MTNRAHPADFQTALVALVEELARSRELMSEVVETLAHAHDVLARLPGTPRARVVEAAART